MDYIIEGVRLFVILAGVCSIIELYHRMLPASIHGLPANALSHVVGLPADLALMSAVDAFPEPAMYLVVLEPIRLHYLLPFTG